MKTNKISAITLPKNSISTAGKYDNLTTQQSRILEFIRNACSGGANRNGLTDISICKSLELNPESSVVIDDFLTLHGLELVDITWHGALAFVKPVYQEEQS